MKRETDRERGGRGERGGGGGRGNSRGKSTGEGDEIRGDLGDFG